MQQHTTNTESKEKARAAMREMALRGEFPGCAPVGYCNIIEGYRKRIVIEKEKARLVRLAFATVATEERSLRSILQDMTALGLRSRNAKPMGVSSFWKMLTNPFYVGLVRYGDIVTQGAHEPLIDKEVFNIVRIKIMKRNRSSRA